MNKALDSVASPAGTDLGLAWSNPFAALGSDFATRLQPSPLPAPYWVGTSASTAELLGLSPQWLQSAEGAAAFTGNTPIAGTQPLASVYSGHQFGVWAGQLGDGRAILLGEVASPAVGGLELQFKGAGRTPYSRMGDGRAVLRSSIREFLCSEAVHALGIATTRALCVTGSDAPVYRETAETAAVVTRVAPSFIRFGHFEHFAARDQRGPLRVLADYVIDRYYPACRHTSQFAGNPYAALLEAVSERTAALMAQWQAVGFCHGVMNTDNMSILGLTIDYGPFQFLDGFNPAHICNHSDTQGRYAFNQQPNVAYWNLFCLAQALLPLMADQEQAMAALESYKTVFPQQFVARMSAKLGLLGACRTWGVESENRPQRGQFLPDLQPHSSAMGQKDGEKWTAAADLQPTFPKSDRLLDTQPDDSALIDATLRLLAAEHTDYTIFWRRLSHFVAGAPVDTVRDLFANRDAFDTWLLQYSERTAQVDSAQSADLMLKTNPKFVLRNHLGEQAIRQAQGKDFSGVARLQRVLQAPCDEHPGFDAYADFPPDWASSIEISCSS